MSALIIAQRNVHRILRIWITVMNNVRMRDRLVKILQYGSQMLLGYWGAVLSRQVRDALEILRKTSSSSRKAFWILKSINNMGIGMQQWRDGYFISTSTLIQKLDAIENIFLLWYYWCETKTYFARSKLFGLKEKAIDYYTNLSWALGDFAYFLAAGLRLKENIYRRKDIEEKLKAQTLNSSMDAHAVTENTHQQELLELQIANERLQSNFLIGVLELVVSLEYAGVYQFLVGRRLHGTYVGLAGVFSSALIIRNGVLDAVAAEDRRESDE